MTDVVIVLDLVAIGEEEEDIVVDADTVAVGDGVFVGYRLQYASVFSVHLST